MIIFVSKMSFDYGICSCVLSICLLFMLCILLWSCYRGDHKFRGGKCDDFCKKNNMKVSVTIAWDETIIVIKPGMVSTDADCQANGPGLYRAALAHNVEQPEDYHRGWDNLRHALGNSLCYVVTICGLPFGGLFELALHIKATEIITEQQLEENTVRMNSEFEANSRAEFRSFYPENCSDGVREGLICKLPDANINDVVEYAVQRAQQVAPAPPQAQPQIVTDIYNSFRAFIDGICQNPDPAAALMAYILNSPYTNKFSLCATLSRNCFDIAYRVLKSMDRGEQFVFMNNDKYNIGIAYLYKAAKRIDPDRLDIKVSASVLQNANVAKKWKKQHQAKIWDFISNPP